MSEPKLPDPSLPDMLVLADAILDQCLADARATIKRNPRSEPVAVVFKHLWLGLGKDPEILTFTIAHLAVRLLKAESVLGDLSG